MARIFISLGSNIEREKYVKKGLNALRQLLNVIEVSSLYACESVGFDGPEFYNIVVGADTELSLETLARKLREIERENGRSLNAVKYSPRTLDLDLLVYDNKICDVPVKLPRDDILKYAFVLWPLAEIAPNLMHPIIAKSYQELWQAFDKTSQKIQQLPLNWLPC